MAFSTSSVMTLSRSESIVLVCLLGMTAVAVYRECVGQGRLEASGGGAGWGARVEGINLSLGNAEGMRLLCRDIVRASGV